MRMAHYLNLPEFAYEMMKKVDRILESSNI